MFTRIEFIGLLDKKGNIHGVPLKPGLNLITGKSATGKSSVIEIFDYCMGESQNTIPAGVISDNAEIFFLLIEIGVKRYLIGRKNTLFYIIDADANEIKDKSDISFEKFTNGSMTSAVFKSQINSLYGLDIESTVEREEDKRRGGMKGAPSFRNAMSFILQHQNLVANKLALFYRFDEREKKEQTIDQFKIFAKFVDARYYSLSQEIDVLKKKVEKAKKVLESEQESIEDRESENALLENTVQMAVVELIFMKTRYLFYNSLGSVSPLIPNNLRSLRHLLGMLLRMDDFANNKVHFENKRIFKNYFYYTWTRSLDDKHQSFIGRISQYQNIISLNKNVINYLSEHIDESKLNNDDTMRRILDGNNYVYNVSVGDVFYVLNFLEQSVTDGQLLKMVFFLRSFYSIQLYERYDMLTEGNDENERVTTKGTIYKADTLLEKTYQLQRVINGSYFTYMPDELLPPSSDYGSRDCKVINGKVLTEFAKELEYSIGAFERNELGNDVAVDDFKYKFRMLEFFALTIKRSIQSRNQPTYMHVDRDSSTAQHISSFGQSTLFVFDVMSLFSNIVNIKLAYNRFSSIENGKMYEFAKSQPWSLLNSMVDKTLRKWCEDTGDDYDEVCGWTWGEKKHRLLSNATIRNGEVLSAVFDQIKNKRYEYRSFKSSSDMLSKFYNNLIKSDMSTYDKADGKPYEMKFVFLDAIKDFLNEPETDEFREIFEFKQGTTVRRSRKMTSTQI